MSLTKMTASVLTLARSIKIRRLVQSRGISIFLLYQAFDSCLLLKFSQSLPLPRVMIPGTDSFVSSCQSPGTQMEPQLGETGGFWRVPTAGTNCHVALREI